MKTEYDFIFGTLQNLCLDRRESRNPTKLQSCHSSRNVPGCVPPRLMIMTTSAETLQQMFSAAFAMQTALLWGSVTESPTAVPATVVVGVGDATTRQNGGAADGADKNDGNGDRTTPQQNTETRAGTRDPRDRDHRHHDASDGNHVAQTDTHDRPRAAPVTNVTRPGCDVKRPRYREATPPRPPRRVGRSKTSNGKTRGHRSRLLVVVPPLQKPRLSVNYAVVRDLDVIRSMDTFCTRSYKSVLI
jgi:hypothetical protein